MRLIVPYTQIKTPPPFFPSLSLRWMSYSSRSSSALKIALVSHVSVPKIMSMGLVWDFKRLIKWSLLAKKLLKFIQMLVMELLAGGGLVFPFLQGLFGVEESAGLKGEVGGVPVGGDVPFRV